MSKHGSFMMWHNMVPSWHEIDMYIPIEGNKLHRRISQSLIVATIHLAIWRKTKLWSKCKSYENYSTEMAMGLQQPSKGFSWLYSNVYNNCYPICATCKLIISPYLGTWKTVIASKLCYIIERMRFEAHILSKCTL